MNKYVLVGVTPGTVEEKNKRKGNLDNITTKFIALGELTVSTP